MGGTQLLQREWLRRKLQLGFEAPKRRTQVGVRVESEETGLCFGAVADKSP